MGYLYLGIAIIYEVTGTGALQVSNGFTKILPSIIVMLGHGCFNNSLLVI